MATCGDIIRLVPGQQGATGAAGTNGTNGTSSFTTLTANMTMPAEGANVTVSVADTTGFTSGQTVFVQGAGFMEVQTISSSTQMVLKNLESAANRAYAANVVAGTVIASGNKIVSGGVQGPSGPLYYALYNHQLASGTDAGDFNNGAWRTVPLNTEVADTGGDGTLAANQVTLTAATYRARWRVMGYQVDRFTSRLYNATLGSVIDYGDAVDAPAATNAQLSSTGETRFTLLAAQAVRLEARCETSNAGDGFGRASPAAFGSTEIYAMLELMKEG